jgi:hypothetical protein
MLSFNEIVKRDLTKNNNKFQIQPLNNSDKARIVKINDNQLDVCLYENKMSKVSYSLIQYTLTQVDLEKENYNIIGFLIKNIHDVIVGFLNLVFEPFDKIRNSEYISGVFKIVLSNNKNQHTEIKELDKYTNNEEIMQILSEYLIEILEVYLD